MLATQAVYDGLRVYDSLVGLRLRHHRILQKCMSTNNIRDSEEVGGLRRA